MHELGAMLDLLPDNTPLVGVHLLDGDRRSLVPTKELELRGRPDAQIDGVILIEAADQDTIVALSASALSDTALAKAGIGLPIRGTYQLQYSLDRNF